jgi:hypothetical protein
MPKVKRIEDMSDAELSRLSGKAYDEAMPEPDTTFGKLGRKALGVMAAPAGAIVGGAYLGTQPGSPGIIDSAKYGAKGMYHAMAGTKKDRDEDLQEYLDATKRAKSIERQRNSSENTNAMGDTYKRGGKVKKMASGGKVSTASRRADGIATKGKTRGTMVVMCGGGMYKGKK